MSAQTIDGKAIAAEVRGEVAARADALRSQGVVPGLATILVGDDPASAVYVRAKRKACAQAGIAARDHDIEADISEAKLLELVDGLNRDPAIHGILVQLPLPGHIDEARVVEAVRPDKDADGFHPANLGRLLSGNPLVVPATPGGIQQLLIRSGFAISGAEVVVVGRSNIVGKPLAALLMQKTLGANATVTVCHTGTADIAGHTRRAEILIAAVGRAHAITGDMVAPGAVVIDVGVNRTETGLTGDVDFEGASQVAAAITPVPGGVGPMTIAQLLHNTVDLAYRSSE
ncbi:MAG: bifunctional methylenetetrahydrofolate dehydrogenase/methenyltetrahydrofolate cyclohydrolase [Actinobacteria bacterium]|nr:bifunctional methylenetetrahydrofolate dehydrogenase/methenyltetrahydrofolate cyclohydrolase [Actinomycetota bacterium]